MWILDNPEEIRKLFLGDSGYYANVDIRKVVETFLAHAHKVDWDEVQKRIKRGAEEQLNKVLKGNWGDEPDISANFWWAKDEKNIIKGCFLVWEHEGELLAFKGWQWSKAIVPEKE